MATGFYTWSKTAGSNATADATINMAEGMAPSAVNDGIRAVMARLAEYRDDISGALTTAGTSTAYTVATNEVFASLSVLNTRVLTIVPHATNGASPTLAVDGLTAQQIRTATGVNVGAGALVAGTPYQVIYFSATTEFILMNYTAPVFSGPVSITGTLAVSDTITVTGSSVAFMPYEGISTEAGAAAGPILSLYRNSASPAASDVIGQYSFNGKDSGGNKTQYGYLQYVITDPTDGSEDADFYLASLIAGTPTTVIRSSGAQIQVPGTLAVTGNLTAANFHGGGRTTQYLTSGTSATYTTPSNPSPKTIVIKMIGGGGGGGAAASNNGSAGTASLFNAIQANPGGGGSTQSGSTGGQGGDGGAAGGGSASLRLSGHGGGAGVGSGASIASGIGGSGLWGTGAGKGQVGTATGQAAGANTGAGGSGGTVSSSGAGGGGGGGEYVEIVIASPAATYTYTVGGGGAGGAAGGQAGGNGGSGLIIVEEYY